MNFLRDVHHFIALIFIILFNTRTLNIFAKIRAKICYLIFVLLFGGSSVSNAVLINNGAYATDTNTGLDWLHNTPLAGQSYNSVLSGFGGYVQDGWRYANGEEINQLVTDYVGPLAILNYQNGYTAFNYGMQAYNAAYNIIELLGINVSFGAPPDPRSTRSLWDTSVTGIVTQGWYDDLGGDPSKVGIFAVAAYIISDGTIEPTIYAMTQIIPDFQSPDDFEGSNVSAILVRDNVASVPEPGTLCLLFAALGLGVLGRCFVSALE